VTTFGELAVEDQRRLVYGPLWVYRAVANAEDPAVTAQFRVLVDWLEASAEVLGQSLAGQAVSTLRDNLDLLWSAFQGDSRGPKRGLREVSRLLKRLPATEAQTTRNALIELADTVADASRWIGAAPVSGPERSAIQDVATWLGLPGSDVPG
jgi:hypothetical protein